jgi:hypothetical protein
MLKWCLDEHTRGKIHVLRSFDGILKYVDIDNIPKAMVRSDLTIPRPFPLVCCVTREVMMIISLILTIIQILLRKKEEKQRRTSAKRKKKERKWNSWKPEWIRMS